MAVSKEAAEKFDRERFCLRKLSDQQFRKQYQIKISNRSVDVKNLRISEEKIRASENITTPRNDRLGTVKLKQHKTCFDTEC